MIEPMMFKKCFAPVLDQGDQSVVSTLDFNALFDGEVSKLVRMFPRCGMVWNSPKASSLCRRGAGASRPTPELNADRAGFWIAPWIA